MDTNLKYLNEKIDVTFKIGDAMSVVRMLQEMVVKMEEHINESNCPVCTLKAKKILDMIDLMENEMGTKADKGKMAAAVKDMAKLAELAAKGNVSVHGFKPEDFKKHQA